MSCATIDRAFAALRARPVMTASLSVKSLLSSMEDITKSARNQPLPSSASRSDREMGQG
jgi:hypothetical protein